MKKYILAHRILLAALAAAGILFLLSNLPLVIMTFVIVGGLYIIVKAHEMAN